MSSKSWRLRRLIPLKNSSATHRARITQFLNSVQPAVTSLFAIIFAGPAFWLARVRTGLLIQADRAFEPIYQANAAARLSIYNSELNEADRDLELRRYERKIYREFWASHAATELPGLFALSAITYLDRKLLVAIAWAQRNRWFQFFSITLLVVFSFSGLTLCSFSVIPNIDGHDAKYFERSSAGTSGSNTIADEQIEPDATPKAESILIEVLYPTDGVARFWRRGSHREIVRGVDMVSDPAFDSRRQPPVCNEGTLVTLASTSLEGQEDANTILARNRTQFLMRAFTGDHADLRSQNDKMMIALSRPRVAIADGSQRLAAVICIQRFDLSSPTSLSAILDALNEFDDEFPSNSVPRPMAFGNIEYCVAQPPDLECGSGHWHALEKQRPTPPSP